MPGQNHQNRVLVASKGFWAAADRTLTNAQPRVYFPKGDTAGTEPTELQQLKNGSEAGWSSKHSWRVEVKDGNGSAGWAAGEVVTVTVGRPSGYREVIVAGAPSAFMLDSDDIKGPVAYFEIGCTGNVAATDIDVDITGYNEGDIQ